jgi:hypothetical protein
MLGGVTHLLLFHKSKLLNVELLLCQRMHFSVLKPDVQRKYIDNMAWHVTGLDYFVFERKMLLVHTCNRSDPSLFSFISARTSAEKHSEQDMK